MTDFEEQVESVDKRHCIDVATAHLEEAPVEDLFVPYRKIAARSRKLDLDFALDTRIFNDVDKLVNAMVIIHLLLEFIEGSVQRMADFVKNHHVVQFLAHHIPERQGQYTILQVEGGCFNLPVLYSQVFGGEKVRQFIEAVASLSGLHFHHENILPD